MALARLYFLEFAVLVNVMVFFFIYLSKMKSNNLSAGDLLLRDREKSLDKKRYFNNFNLLRTAFHGSKSNKTDGFINRDHIARNKDEQTSTGSVTKLNGLIPAVSETIVQQRRAIDTLLEGRRNTDSMYRIITLSTEKTAKLTLNPETADALRESQPVYVANYVMENENLCSSVVDLSAVIIVHTAPYNFKIRDAIRDTWANNSYYLDLGTVRILFLLGLVNDSKIQDLLELEFLQHRDLLQGDFIDDYHNLTLKGVMAYKWLTEKCRNAQIIVKTDDDVVVNMMDVLTNITSFKNRKISCSIQHLSAIFRDPARKWYAADKFFPRFAYYPDYCHGPLVIFSNDLIPDLYRSSLVTPFFWIDDVYLYGLVPGNLPKVTFNDIYPRVEYDDARFLRRSWPCTAVVMLKRNVQQMFRIWNLMLNSYMYEPVNISYNALSLFFVVVLVMICFHMCLPPKRYVVQC